MIYTIFGLNFSYAMKSLKFLLVSFFIVYTFGFFKPAIRIGHPGADIEVYKTFTDYLNGKSEKMDDLERYFPSNKVILFFILNGEKKVIKCQDIWGFKVNKRLFRIDQRYEQPVALVDS